MCEYPKESIQSAGAQVSEAAMERKTHQVQKKSNVEKIELFITNNRI